VNKIKQETDVMINIPDNDQGVTSIRIEGSKTGVDKAKKASNKRPLISLSLNERIMMTVVFAN